MKYRFALALGVCLAAGLLILKPSSRRPAAAEAVSTSLQAGGSGREGHGPRRPTAGEADTIALQDLPEWYWDDPHLYRVDPYLRAAAILQKMGKEKAVAKLQSLALARPFETKVIVLCRMLFCRKEGKELRPPFLGAAHYLTETAAEDWPLQPITLVDGVPFIIVMGYSLAGCPEPGTSYLAYCLKSCDWSQQVFQPKPAAEKEAALKKLLSSRKLQKLSAWEQRFLENQIKD